MICYRVLRKRAPFDPDWASKKAPDNTHLVRRRRTWIAASRRRCSRTGSTRNYDSASAVKVI
jgi:hypothetical protein